jgi:phosphatidylglycerol:prolipoprotein diacylglycerol transferase
MLSLPFPNIDPILFHIGPVKVHWYGIAYAVGIILGWLYSRYLVRTYLPDLSYQYLDNFITWIVVSIVVGGRLGHIIFYDFHHYLQNPIEIFMTWKGGMSFHGALVGCLLGITLYCYKINISFLRFCDICASSCTIGLGLGRIANFINNELYGTVSNVPWAVVFPERGIFPRHPSQIYEAFGEGFLLWLVLHFAWKISVIRNQPGRIAGIFALQYGIVRFLVEYVREPEILHNWCGMVITQGQLLSLPLIVLGIYWLYPNDRASQH